MKHTPLEVTPMKKAYAARYPSYLDRNPLLYPETRPYPYSQRLIQAVSTTGLVGALMFSSNVGQAQKADQDTLYNTFPLSAAYLPYTPVSFGTGLPSRITSEEANTAIRRAFEEMNIDLQNDYLIDRNGSLYHATGYNEELHIGYVWLDYYNMGDGMSKGGYAQASNLSPRRSVEKSIDNMLEEFDKDTDSFIKKNVRFIRSVEKKEERIKAYQAIELLHGQERRDALIRDYMNQSISSLEDRWSDGKMTPTFTTLWNHTKILHEDLIDQYLTLRQVSTLLRESKRDSILAEPIDEQVREISQYTDPSIADDHISALHDLVTNRFSSNGRTTSTVMYRQQIAEIIKNHNWQQWKEHYYQLDEIIDKQEVSLKEAKAIDRNNKNARDFIAPISIRDDRAIVPDYVISPLNQKRKEFYEEYARLNGITPEITNKKKEELKLINDKYKGDRSKEAQSRKRAERDIVRQKYEDMELLTDEEKEAFKLRFAEVEREIDEDVKRLLDEKRQDILSKLEEDVKRYIMWAKSQQGY